MRRGQVLPGTEEALKCKARYEEEMRLKALKSRHEVRRPLDATVPRPRPPRAALLSARARSCGWLLACAALG
jgi:hypothetical protein